MSESKSTLSFIGIGFGAVALMLALVHFWAGSFSPQPTLEQVVSKKVVSIRNATISALKGEATKPPVKTSSDFNLDQLASLSTAVLGGLAFILGVMGIALKESFRVAGGAVVLGTGAIAFQFAVMALGVLVVVILIFAILNGLGLG